MIGETLGSYRVVAKLGEGGMGAVYAGEHVVLGRRAAIKLLLPSLSSNQELVQRFFNEARATATLDHPGLVQVLDYGHAASGSAFLVMELLAGETIARRLARTGRLDYASAAGFCRQAAAAVGVAHAAGIVHRDLKPDNLFLVRDAEVALGERVKVLDFGIAKLTDPGPGVSSMTRTGAVLGTPWYMSPEQCRGAGEVDQRSDIYALGCILFEMVCGRPPFVGAGTGEIIGAHIFQERPSPRAFDPAIPPALEAIIGRALQKDPAARQQSMQQLGAELEELARLGTRGGAAAVSGGGWQAGPAPLGFAATAAISGAGHAAAATARPLGAVGAPPTTLSGAAGARAPAARSRSWLVPALIAGALGVAVAGIGFYALKSRGGGRTDGASGPEAAAQREPEGEPGSAGGRPTPGEPGSAGVRPTQGEPGSARVQPPRREPEGEPGSARVQPPQREPEGEPAPDREPAHASGSGAASAPDLELALRAASRAAGKPAQAPAGSRSTTSRIGASAKAKSIAPSPERPAEAIPFAPRQIWSGDYVCAQGRTSLDLQITSVRDDLVDAVFEFSHAASGTSGSFRMSGRYDPARRALALSPGAWIHRPSGYLTVGLSGTVSADGSTFAGAVGNSSCSTFAVRRR